MILLSELYYHCFLCECSDCRYFLDRYDIVEGSEEQILTVRVELNTLCCCMLYHASFHMHRGSGRITSHCSAYWTSHHAHICG